MARGIVDLGQGKELCVMCGGDMYQGGFGLVCINMAASQPSLFFLPDTRAIIANIWKTLEDNPIPG